MSTRLLTRITSWQLRKKGWLSIVIFVALGVLFSPRWLPAIGSFLIVADPLQQADAVVILAGDENERIAYGARLLQKGFADWYILTNMWLPDANSSRTYLHVVSQKAVRQGVPEERILVIRESVETTYEEATRLRKVAEELSFTSLIVVTSPYHTRRARWIMQEVFDNSDMNLIFRPAEGHAYRADDWWRSPLSRRQTSSEYAKILAHLFGCRQLDYCGPLSPEWLRALRSANRDLDLASANCWSSTSQVAFPERSSESTPHRRISEPLRRDPVTCP